MDEKVSFSGQQLSLASIASHYRDVEDALRELYFHAAASHARFVGYTASELQSELDARLAEEGQMLALSVLAAVEAAFRVDYLQRVYGKKKDPLSKSLRYIYKAKGTRAKLEDDILDCWRHNSDVSRQLISDLKSAFGFRHWLAHGRYWTPKLGRSFDYFNVHMLAEQASEMVPSLAE